MNYLFVNTAEGTRVLLEVNGVTYYAEDMVKTGSAALMPMIDGVFKRAGVSPKAVDIFGACIGPGSFTGLRIGLTTIKSFCYALGKPCFAVNNLRLNSYNNKADKVISVADAGNKVCYIARYNGENVEDDARCVTLDDAKKIIAEHPDYAVATDIKLSTVFGSSSSAVGETEMKKAASLFMKNAIDQKALEPLYVRKAQPERGAGDL